MYWGHDFGLLGHVTSLFIFYFSLFFLFSFISLYLFIYFSLFFYSFLYMFIYFYFSLFFFIFLYFSFFAIAHSILLPIPVTRRYCLKFSPPPRRNYWHAAKNRSAPRRTLSRQIPPGGVHVFRRGPFLGGDFILRHRLCLCA